MIFFLMNIAEKLNIQTPPVTETQVKKAEEEIKDIKNKIDEIESTAVWHWFFVYQFSRKRSDAKKDIWINAWILHWALIYQPL